MNKLSAGGLLLATIGLAIALRWWFPLSSSLLEKAELRSIDARFLIRGPLPEKRLQKISQEVAIVAMDDSATQKLGHPIPRRVHAKLVKQLQKSGARAVIFDVIFTDPNRTDPGGDIAFAKAVADAGDVFLPFDHDSSQPTPERVLSRLRQKLAYPIDVKSSAQAVHIRPPIPPLFAAMRGGGHIASKRDSDGTFRSSILLMEIGAVYPHTVLDAVAKSVWKLNPKTDPPVLRDEYLQWDDHRIGPLAQRFLDRNVYRAGEIDDERLGTAWAIPLNFLGGHDAMQVLTVPYLDVLSGRATERLKGRVVIIGETATGTPDLRRSPFDQKDEFLGVETNATLIANLLDNDFLKPATPLEGALVAVVLGLLAGFFALRFAPGLSLLLCGGVLIAYGMAAVFTFAESNRVWGITTPFLCVALCYTSMTAFRLFVTDREARSYEVSLRETQTLLGQYVNQSLAAQLAADPEMRRDMQIGTRREVTVLFSDIRGFTSWSETQTPEEVKARLDEYFPLMCEIIADDYDGYVDKFVGDGLMAVWNCMSEQDDHAERAVRAALSMKRGLALLNVGWRKQNQAEFEIGIGIATGTAVFGTFGSPRHKLMPTVLGDTVNLASRLEALTKETGVVIIASHETHEQTKNSIEVRPLGEVEVRGMAARQPIYEVLSYKGASSDSTQASS